MIGWLRNNREVLKGTPALIKYANVPTVLKDTFKSKPIGLFAPSTTTFTSWSNILGMFSPEIVYLPAKEPR